MVLTENAQRLLRIEAKLDVILGHLEISFDPKHQIQALAHAGDKIAAIRLHRACFTSGLADAKKYVEELGRSTKR